MHVLREDLVCSLLKPEQVGRGEKRGLGFGEELVRPGRAVGLSVAVVLVLKIFGALRLVLRND